MGTGRRIPKPKAVFDDPEAYLDFVAASSDAAFEGQYFERKEACRPRPDGIVAKSDLKKLDGQITECVSAFCNTNRDGGLLILGIGSAGEIHGVDHLNENHLNGITKLENKLVHYHCDVRVAQITTNSGDSAHIALFLAHYVDKFICEEVGSKHRAWTRLGSQNLLLSDVQREQLRRDKGIVDFERTPCCEFIASDLDRGVVKEFRHSRLESSSYDWTDAELLYQVGALRRVEGRSEQFGHSGLLFFAGNPQRVLPYAHIRLLRFDVPLAKRQDRPLPTHDQQFTGSLTKQIRDFRTFVSESAFFKTYQFRDPRGGFREEPEYPFIAIDEAIVNAIAHRDYAVRVPIHCEKYTDALIVKSPGALRQQKDVPQHFSLNDTVLEHLARNALLTEWLKAIRDAKGSPYIRALQEGTRRMREEMIALGLPAPEYDVGPSYTEVILRNDAERREATVGQATAEPSEYTNLYPIIPGIPGGPGNDGRRALASVIADRLRANDWFIDSMRFGTITAHRRGNARDAPPEILRVVRLYPAYTIKIREYHKRPFCILDPTVVVQSVLTATQAIAKFGSARLFETRAIVQTRGGWYPGQIVEISSEFCKVRLSDLEIEEVVPSTKVIPRLPRKLIDEAIASTGVNYDLAREIKLASLSLDANAARSRAERTQRFAEELATNILPVTLASEAISISTRPVMLTKRGKGDLSFQVDGLVEPEVEFHMRHSGADIREGITRFGSFEHQPRDIELVPIAQPNQMDNMRALIERLRVGKFKYRGAERTFSTKLSYSAVIPAEPQLALSECERLLEQHPFWVGDPNLPRLFLVHSPERGQALDDENTPYYLIKRFLLEAGVPCQMVDTPTLVNPDYKDLNLALNIAAKCGVAPWVLPESIPDADFFVGLSYTQSSRGSRDRRMGFANVFNEYGRWEFYSGGTHAFLYEERVRYYEELVENTLKRLPLPEAPTICFHYSAKFSREDRDAMLRAARRVRPKGKYVFVWINTHHHVRLYDKRPETDGSLARGRYVVAGKNQIYLSTTGYNPYRKTLGTPHFLELNARIERSDDAAGPPPDLRVLAMQVLSLTKLNWASTDSLCAEPITTKYAGDIAYLAAAFVRQGGQFRLHGALEGTPWFI